MIKFERKIVKTSQNTFIVSIPLEIRKALDINKSDILEVWIDDNKIVMKKK